MSKIHVLKKDGELLYPQTHVLAVVDDNGNTVDKLIDNKLDKNSISNTTGTSDTLVMSQKSITDAIAVEKARAEGKELELNNAITDETAAREAVDKAINDTIGTIAEGKTVVEMIEDAQAAAEAATTKIADKTSGHVTISVDEDENTGALTYTISESDIASATGLTAEIGRATSTETALANRLAVIEGEAEGSIKKAIADAKSELIGDAAEGYNTLGKLEDKVIAAEAAAIAAATVVAENSEFITIEQTGEVGKTQTYTIKTQDIASIGDLAAEISRAQEAEQGNSDAINSIKSDYLKSFDKLELSQAIVSETEARIQAISNLEFKNSLKLDGVVQSEELLTTLSDVQSGALYSVGPDSNDQYKLYAYVNSSWTYMGYLNSSSIDITQSLGQSQNLAISQKAVTDALTPIIMTQAEFDALVSNGTITDDDLTIRYIID